MPDAVSADDRAAVGPGAETLPRAPGALRRFWHQHPRLVDGLVAGVYLVVEVFGILSVWLATGAGSAPVILAVQLTAAAVSSGVLLVRRRRPWVAFAVIAGAAVVVFLADGSLNPVAPAFALYALAVYGSSRGAWTGFAVATALALMLPVSAVFAGDRWSFNPVFVAVTLIATLLGVAAGDRRRYVAALRERAVQLTRERDQQARIATIAERARIAREMHDVVAHSLSVMVSLSDGAEALADQDPARSREAMREVGDVGRRSLAEMRRALGVLEVDDGAAPLAPQPSLADLPALVETLRAAGLPVSVESTGTPPSSDGMQTTVYRIVQEALTNALRYAQHPSVVLVRTSYGDAGTEIDVTDDGALDSTPQPSLGSSRGLVGIRERAALYGGTVEAGPQPLRGWRVRVTLPQAGEDA